MPSPPRTPRPCREFLNDDDSFVYSSPGSHKSGVLRKSHRRNSSLQSTRSTPARRQSQGSLDFSSTMSDGTPLAGDSNELTNLADELADAWSEDAADETDSSCLAMDETIEALSGSLHCSQDQQPARTRDNGIGINSSTAHTSPQDSILASPRKASFLNHQQVRSQPGPSDGWHEPGSDEPVALSLALEASMASIERFTRSVPNRGCDGVDGVVVRMLDELKDLGSQAGVENGATRLITAHTSLTTHIVHETRSLYSLIYPLLSPLSVAPDLDTIDALLPLITTAVTLIPQTSSLNLSSISQLTRYTTDVIQSLSYLSDTLHMTRQTTTLATRRLRSTRELVAEMRRDTEAMEAGIQWIDRGGWQKRLADRECASVCRDVVGGFEEACCGLRERLAAGA